MRKLIFTITITLLSLGFVACKQEEVHPQTSEFEEVASEPDDAGEVIGDVRPD